MTANPTPGNAPRPLPLDVERSRQAGSRFPKNLSVFERAWRTAEQLQTTGTAYYVQGFVAGSRSQPQEHAWVEQADRRIDPNLPHLPGDPAQFGYFVGRRFTVPQVRAAIASAQEDYPEDDALPIYDPAPYAYYGDRFLGGVAYQQAWAAAIAHRP
ncbi:MAG: hypothetical protein HC918_05360 [Oscillatoriales cyanobacterium SM2_1_8]|nr:hypothetical protein [Oscillatoriales cyanobacterium SM2_1_8]